MVKIVLAGGTGNVGREILDALIAKGTHELTVFTRSDTPHPDLEQQGVSVVKVNYNDKDTLTTLLTGVDVVLSFVIAASDPEGETQKNLIDASVAAGVKRFAPSEWSSRSGTGGQYASKDIVHQYLREINKEKKVLEYSLFQLGLFTNYLGAPHQTTKHIQLFNVHLDLENRRGIVPAEGDMKLTFTTAQDLARVVAEAVDYQGVWPETGGINGHTLTNSELLKLAEELRGPLKIEKVSRADLDAGKLNTSWVPQIEHPSIPPAQRTRELSETVIARTLVSGLAGSWVVSDEWNKLLPNLKFTTVDEFLTSVWEAKP